MKNLQIALPLWVRAVLLAGVFCVVAGAGLISYRLYQRPKTSISRRPMSSSRISRPPVRPLPHDMAAEAALVDFRE